MKALLDAAKTLHQEIESGVGTDKAMLRMTNKEKDTALHEAVRYHHSEIVVSLIEEDPEFIYGANITGYTPLYMAAERGYGDLVCIIIDKTRASPSHSGIMGRTALHAAVIREDQGITHMQILSLNLDSYMVSYSCNILLEIMITSLRVMLY